MFQNQDLNRRLISFQHRKLNAGESFILAQAIVSKLPLPASDCDNITLAVQNHMELIEKIIYGLGEFCYIDRETIETIRRDIVGLMSWRFAIAYSPIVPLYSEVDNVIDDISGLCRYVDPVRMCSVKDIIDTANYTTILFKDYVAEF